MPNHAAPKTINEVVEILQAGFDEEDFASGKLDHKKLDEELHKRGLDIQPSLERVQDLLKKLRGKQPAKVLSPIEALYQKCRQALPKSLHKNVLGMVQLLKSEDVPRVAVYAAAIKPNDSKSISQFQRHLAKLSEASKQRKD